MHTKTLASAIGIALLGASFSVPATVAPGSANHAEARQSYFVRFAEVGLLHYDGGIQGIAATSPEAVGTRKLDAHSPAALAYSQYLEDQRAGYIAAIGQKLGGQVPATHQYGITMNAVAMELTASEAAKVASVPGVVSVKPAGTYELDTYRGPAFIGADKIWDGTSTPTGIGTLGEGILAAVIDGGANSDHPSFANDATCGFDGANPKLTAFDCSSTDGTGACNGPNPEANPTFGHGVHTASTVAGNTIDNTAVPAPALPDGRTMSGVAPCAQIVQFKACPSNSCGGPALAAGIENAIVAGADVLNYSISGGTSPWNDLDRAFLDAVDADVFIAASAGNNRPPDQPEVIGMVNHRGPWVMTVAASTQDELVGPSISLSGPGTPPAETSDIPMIPGDTTTSSPELTDKPIKTYPANVEGCSAFPAGTFTGSIALLSRGTCAFTDKITNATNAGADMVVIYNNTGVIPIAMSTPGAPPTPAFGIAMADGLALSAFIDANPTDSTADTIAIAGGVLQGDVLADFSYRGPTPAPLADLQKPDITAPGVLIYAGTDDASGNYQFMSGTSMSSPHTAGSAALVRAVNPTWTVPEVKSAIQTTAKSGGFQEDGVTSWNIDDVGSGRVDLAKAALAGLTLDETFANFLAANPAGGSIDVKDLNLAALRNVSCIGECTWTRTVTNKLDVAGTWDTSFVAESGGFTAEASPASFTLAPGASQVVTITATPPAGPPMAAIGFGNLIFSEANGMSPDQHFTVAIKGEPPVVIDKIFADGFDGDETLPPCEGDCFQESWDSYATGSQVHGQGGWKGWANDPVAGAFVVDTQSVSMPNSIEIAGGSDLIHEFDYDSGAWTITAKQYIPSSFSGQSYFIFQNVYNDAQVALSWSVQVIFDSATGMVSNEPSGADQGSTPFVTDEWADLRLDVDLDADTQTFSYNGTVVYSGSWSNQFPNQTTPGIAEIGAIDLFANGATEVYYDNIQIAPATP